MCCFLRGNDVVLLVDGYSSRTSELSDAAQWLVELICIWLHQETVGASNYVLPTHQYSQLVPSSVGKGTLNLGKSAVANGYCSWAYGAVS